MLPVLRDASAQKALEKVEGAQIRGVEMGSADVLIDPAREAAVLDAVRQSRLRIAPNGMNESVTITVDGMTCAARASRAMQRALEHTPPV